MSNSTADKSFVQLAYQESALMLEGEDLETLTARSEDGTVLPDVRLVHKPSGTTIDVSECRTQMQNMVIARIRMVRALTE
jgi:protein subunit release factor A